MVWLNLVRLPRTKSFCSTLSLLHRAINAFCKHDTSAIVLNQLRGQRASKHTRARYNKQVMHTCTHAHARMQKASKPMVHTSTQQTTRACTQASKNAGRHAHAKAHARNQFTFTHAYAAHMHEHARTQANNANSVRRMSTKEFVRRMSTKEFNYMVHARLNACTCALLPCRCALALLNAVVECLRALLLRACMVERVCKVERFCCMCVCVCVHCCCARARCMQG